MARYKCDACGMREESGVIRHLDPHYCTADRSSPGVWREIANKPAPAAHSFKAGDRVRFVRFVRGLSSAVVGTIGSVTGVSPSAATVAFLDPDGVSRSVTFVSGSDVYNLDAIERIDAAPGPTTSATIPALAPIHDGSLGYTRAAWEEREAAHARKLAALRVQLDTETERANRLADQCGVLRGGKARVEAERDRAQAELLRTRRRR